MSFSNIGSSLVCCWLHSVHSCRGVRWLHSVHSCRGVRWLHSVYCCRGVRGCTCD